MHTRTIFGIPIALALVLASLYAFFLAVPIDLTTADLGRHIKNGQLFFETFRPLNTNFYSYTHSEFPVLNHHWGSGIVFFLIEKFFGFVGLSVFYMLLCIAAFLLLFWIAWKEAGFTISALMAVFLIPLMAHRMEIRPEGFSYLFSALFFFILWKHKRGEIAFRWLFILPIFSALWVNLHIYFVLGAGIIGAFLLSALIRKEDRSLIKRFGIIAMLTALAGFVNPFGIDGALYPFAIFREYGYTVLENQSVWFLENIHFPLPNLRLFEIALALYVCSVIAVLIKRRAHFHFALFFITAFFGIMGFFAVRNFALFALFALPSLSLHVSSLLSRRWIQKNFPRRVFPLVCAFVILFANYKSIMLHVRHGGIGLAKGNSGAAEFFLRAGIKGPIFNNYDIGGYLVYYLFPDERVFVDNRPEAYPAAFFQKEYIPMQEDVSVWNEKNKAYGFNAIVFGYHDATPWGKMFLRRIINDPSWAPVYFDKYALVLLKRTFGNQKIIEKYDL
ncbi:MAG: hypothetical protein UW24_C0012G0050 [Parcubacteria group bacterium GW2011_GWA2_44_12]|nr:MAG: hypothetical protein UW24_C0012G0050 [Parcubacteria group bacterium GW2011_GWA2_44_12]